MAGRTDTIMLAAIFVAANREDIPCLPYARELIRLGLRSAGVRLDRIDPVLCQQFLGDRLAEADWESRFLTGSWQTLVSRTWPLLTERVVRTFGGADFRPADLLSPEPISVYLRLSERDMRGLKPLLKLVWEMLLNELVAHYDRTAGAGCHPVLLLLDEAARFAVPSLPEYAATVPGRGISLWVAVQSLSQLDSVYGRAAPREWATCRGPVARQALRAPWPPRRREPTPRFRGAWGPFLLRSAALTASPRRLRGAVPAAKATGLDQPGSAAP